ncbi:MAG: hypothetical protein OXM61_18185 [Candidatus Poribacteria bacterium]|nr:hypothetical protein [Candidatus Poribacteria bacterium]
MKYSKILTLLGIGCVAGLLLVYGVKLQAQNKIKMESIAVNPDEMKAQAMSRIEQFRNRQQGSNEGTPGRQQASRWGGQQRSSTSDSKGNQDFYKMIVDNNLFRPLGWRPPNREPEYAFISTRVDPTGTFSEAYFSEQRSNQLHRAKVGDKVGEVVVKEIESKKITLDKNGETITLRRGNSPFLNSGSRRSSSRSESSNRDQNNNNDTSKSDKEATMKNAREDAEKRMREEMMKRAAEMRRRFGNASREERMRMIREYGGRRGRGR